MTLMIAPYITVPEYRCSCCGTLPLDLYDDNDHITDVYANFFEYFAIIRGEWGKPIPITSGYRCPVHNVAVGGNRLSVHQWGLALDLDCGSDDEVEELSNLLDVAGHSLRVGKYKGAQTFVHIDMAYSIYPRASTSWVKGVRWNG